MLVTVSRCKDSQIFQACDASVQELQPSNDKIYARLDAAQRGQETGSCGHQTQPKYRVNGGSLQKKYIPVTTKSTAEPLHLKNMLTRPRSQGTKVEEGKGFVALSLSCFTVKFMQGSAGFDCSRNNTGEGGEDMEECLSRVGYGSKLMH